MKKQIYFLLGLIAIGMVALAKDFVIEFKGGDTMRFPTADIEELTFEPESVAMPDDPYPSATDFSRRVLLLEHTGTKCGYCPLMAMGLRTLEDDPEYADRFTLACLHSYEGDPMGNNFIREFSSAYMPSAGWPYTSADFKADGVGAYTNYNMIADKLRDLVKTREEAVTPSGVGAITKFDGSTIEMTLAVKAAEDGDYRVGAILLEDGIKAPQTNYQPESTGDANFDTHNNVVRTVVGRNDSKDFTGIDLGHISAGEYGHTCQTITLTEGWKAENCKLIVYVSEKIDGQYVCVNSQYASLYGNTGFEYASQNPSTDSYLSLDRTLVESSRDGENHSVGYTYKKTESGRELSVATDSDWIADLSDTGSEITFSTEENKAEEPRTGKIVIAYGDARPIEITVIQQGQAPTADENFRLTAQPLSPYTAGVTIEPINYTGNYLFLVAKCEIIDSYIEAGNLQGWIDGDIAYLKSVASNNGMTLEQMLPHFKQGYAMNGESVEMTYKDLDYDTDYYIYCYGLTLQGEVTTKFHKKRFRTGIVASVDMTFESTVSGITETSAKIEVTPSNDEHSYFWTYVSEMDWEQYDIFFIMENMISNIMYEVAFGTDINDILHKGPSSEEAKGLWSGTNYYLVGWGMDEQGSPTTEPMTIGTFKTLNKTLTSDCTFQLRTTEVRDNDIQLNIKPSDNSVRYYAAFVEEAKCEGYGDEQMAQRLINMENSRFELGYYGEDANWGNVDWMLSGEQTVWGRQDLYWTFSPNRNYKIYVFGVDENGERTTEIGRLDQRTNAPISSNLKIDVSLTSATWNYGTFHFVPSNDDEYYMPFLVETDELQYIMNDDGTLNEELLCEEIEHYYDNAPNYYTYRGERDVQFHWISDRDYTMLVCGWSGGNTTDFFRFETHTPPIGFGEGKGDVECTWELFDATALSEIDYDRWKEFLGYVVMRLQFTPNEDAANFYGGVWMPVTNYLDTGGEDHLLTLLLNPMVSIVNRKTAMYRTLCYGETYSLSYVADDFEGKYGPWHYMEFTPTEGVNITPAYDFWTPQSTRPEKIYAISPSGETVTIKDTTGARVSNAMPAEGSKPAKPAKLSDREGLTLKLGKK